MEPQQTCPTEEMLLMLSETAPSAIEEVEKYPGFSLPPASNLPAVFSILRNLGKTTRDAKDSLRHCRRMRYGSENKSITSTVQLGFLIFFFKIHFAYYELVR